MRRAVEEAYRELPQLTFWSYYRRWAIINTVSSQTSSTITYVHSTRTVTLASGTFPSAARQYRIIIDNVHYDIESYTDSTNIVLPENSNPGADVAAGTTYTLYKAEYLLPTTFRRCLGLWDVDQRRPITIIDDQCEQQVRFGGYSTPGTPYAAAIRNTGEHVNRMSVVFSPPPGSATAYELLYEALPRPFVLPEKYSTGTLSISSGSASVTGSGTTFPANCAGCILRVSTSTTQEPTGQYGALIDGEDVDNPYTFQSEVLTRGSATALTLKDNADQAYSAVKYSLSDPLDIEDGAMFTAFLHLAAAKYAQMQGDSKYAERQALANNSLIYAKEFDNRRMQTRAIDWDATKYRTPVTTEGA